ncbi:MAG: PilN domain-containing protein [Gammaproteobacteria bacterium]|nr:PilN domain-containing protein [Gammaproteobacteria bacterium]
MQQDINLYKLLPKKQKPLFTWGRLGFIYIFFVFLIFLQFIFAILEKNHLVKEHQQAESKLENTKQQFHKLIAQYPSINTKNIQTIANSMREELKNELKIIQLLMQSSTFSAYFQGLAAAAVPNVWLTTISFAAKEPHIVLQGNALEALSAQQYLDQLARQSIFINLPFKINDLTQTTLNKSPVFTFNISTKTQTQNE